MSIELVSIGEVFECNTFKNGEKDILIKCVVRGTEEDSCKPWISAYSGDGEHFDLDIVRNGNEGECFDFTEERVEDILNKAKAVYLQGL